MKLIPIIQQIDDKLSRMVHEAILQSIESIFNLTEVTASIMSQQANLKHLLDADETPFFEIYIIAKAALYYVVDLENKLAKTSEYLSRTQGVENAIFIFELLKAFQEHERLESELTENFQQLDADHKIVLQTVMVFYFLLNREHNLLLEQQNVDYLRRISESRYWISTQIDTCLDGMKKILRKDLSQVELQRAVEDVKPWKVGLLKHTEVILGPYVDEWITENLALLADHDKHQQIIELIKQQDWYKAAVRALDGETHAGYATYFSSGQFDRGSVLTIIDNYLNFQIHINQAIFVEQSIVNIREAMQRLFNVEKAIEVLSLLGSDERVLTQTIPFDELPTEVRQELIRLNAFYVMAKIKFDSCFYVDESANSKILQWTVMWAQLQRQRCIEGLFYIQSDTFMQTYESTLPADKVEVHESQQPVSSMAVDDSDEGSSQAAVQPEVSAQVDSQMLRGVASAGGLRHFNDVISALEHNAYSPMNLLMTLMFNGEIYMPKASEQQAAEREYIASMVWCDFDKVITDTLRLKIIFYLLAARQDVGQAVMQKCISQDPYCTRLRMLNLSGNPQISLLDALACGGANIVTPFLSGLCYEDKFEAIRSHRRLCQVVQSEAVEQVIANYEDLVSRPCLVTNGRGAVSVEKIKPGDRVTTESGEEIPWECMNAFMIFTKNNNGGDTGDDKRPKSFFGRIE